MGLPLADDSADSSTYQTAQTGTSAGAADRADNRTENGSTDGMGTAQANGYASGNATGHADPAADFKTFEGSSGDSVGIRPGVKSVAAIVRLLLLGGEGAKMGDAYVLGKSADLHEGVFPFCGLTRSG